MKTPPIPPNCQYFNFDEENQQHYFASPNVFVPLKTYSDPQDGAWRLQHSMRPIIAAVARCAWLDEAEKRRFWEANKQSSHNYDYREAEENAALWKQWGLIQEKA